MEEVDNIDAAGIEIYPKDKYQLDNKHNMSYYDLEDLIHNLENSLHDLEGRIKHENNLQLWWT